MTIALPPREFIWVPSVYDTTGRNEGGFTFLKRMLQTAITTAQPVIFSDGDRVFEYTHRSTNRQFADGVKQLDKSHPHGLLNLAMDQDMRNYSIALGIMELQREGRISAADISPAGTRLSRFLSRFER